MVGQVIGVLLPTGKRHDFATLRAAGHPWLQEIVIVRRSSSPGSSRAIPPVSAGRLNASGVAVCGSTHRESYLDIVMVGIVSALVALVAVVALGSMFGSF